MLAVMNAKERHTRQVIRDLSESIRERDVTTYEHSRRVATYAQRIARHMGWDRASSRDLALAALVHDLGKTWIGNDILLKEGPLSKDEQSNMERHPVIAARILTGYDLHPFFIETVLYHHESFDGRGYPSGLSGEDIPLGARILAVADAFDALTSKRPYKPALTVDMAKERILISSATHFDPHVVAAFISLLESRGDSFLLPQKHADLPGALPRRGMLRSWWNLRQQREEILQV